MVTTTRNTFICYIMFLVGQEIIITIFREILTTMAINRDAQNMTWAKDKKLHSPLKLQVVGRCKLLHRILVSCFQYCLLQVKRVVE